jgi:glutamine amidotransferase
MCRWAAYIGEPIFINELLFDPSHSLIKQSKQAEECKTSINADGLGLAWYHERPEPGIYRDVYPAWSDTNLESIATQIKTGLFLAHVRASTGSAISRNNCHPFVVGKWSFMHNGQVGGFEDFRKKADMAIPESLYQYRKGATDSEVLFLLALGYGLTTDPYKALKLAVRELQEMSEKYGRGPAMRLSAAFSDGEKLYAVRYASDDRAPTLY